MAPNPPKLPPFGALNTVISQRDAPGLATLFNSQTSDSPALFSLLKSASQRVIQIAAAQPTSIDSLLTFFSLAASKLSKSLQHEGDASSLPPRDQQRLPKQLITRAASGFDLLAEHLGVQLFTELWNPTARLYTPHIDLDENKGKEYYRSAYVNAALLARAFTVNASFRERLWRTVEEVLIKGIFSGTMQEPGNFVVTSVVVYGAGNALRDWLSRSDNQGHGKGWYQYTDTLNEPEAKWGWYDIVSALLDTESILDLEFEKPLPEKGTRSKVCLTTWEMEGLS